MKLKLITLATASALMMLSSSLALVSGSAYAQTAEATTPAENQIEAMNIAEQGGVVYVELKLNKPLASKPANFSVNNPARIAFDFAGVANGLSTAQQTINRRELVSANVVQVGDRTRLVLNLSKLVPYTVELKDSSVLIALSSAEASSGVTNVVDEAVTTFSSSKPQAGAPGVSSLLNVNFRRGDEGTGKIVVDLSDASTTVDIRKQGTGLAIDFGGTLVPESLHRRFDVSDFGTPVKEMTVQQQDKNARIMVQPTGLWDYSAYQSDTQFVLEVRRIQEDPNKLIQGRGLGYQGEKLSLNFQDIDVRSALQVIADFTDFNIVTSDSVSGNLTLRLQDVPWDQALDIILQARSLDKRKTGNVIWIAPSDEIRQREKLAMEAEQEKIKLEPVVTESFQLNYHRAGEVADFLRNGEKTMLSERGTVVYDERSNRMFVTDIGSRLDEVRRVLEQIDVAPRQVLIEARIVEASKNFGRNLGVRLGVGGNTGKIVGYRNGVPIYQGTIGGSLGSTSSNAGGVVGTGDDQVPGGTNVNLPAGSAANAISMVLWNNAATRYLNLELSAMEQDGRGRIVSSPKVMTANQVKAMVSQGEEIPYKDMAGGTAGGTTTSFKDAKLTLEVTPQITPDGRVQLKVNLEKKRADRSAALGPGQEPPLLTRAVETDVLVMNGGTVVIGGVMEETDSTLISRTPFFGELPILGHLFRSTEKKIDTMELMIFITPRIVTDELASR